MVKDAGRESPDKPMKKTLLRSLQKEGDSFEPGRRVPFYAIVCKLQFCKVLGIKVADTGPPLLSYHMGANLYTSLGELR